MRKLKLTKLIASLLMVTSVLALNPIRANAEWKRNPFGWWYKEGNSWAVGWRNIDRKWYYFNTDGYMLYDTTVNGCYLSSSGAWIITNNAPVASSNFKFYKETGTILEYTGTDTTLTIPSTIKGAPVKKIGEFAFYKKSELTNITIPDSVTSIEKCAFNACVNLTSINIPHSVTSIGESAFASCHSLTTLIIPDSVTSIGLDAFNSCSGLKSVTIPDSVISIGHNAFDNCYALFYVKSEKAKQLLMNSGVNASKITVNA